MCHKAIPLKKVLLIPQKINVILIVYSKKPNTRHLASSIQLFFAEAAPFTTHWRDVILDAFWKKGCGYNFVSIIYRVLLYSIVSDWHVDSKLLTDYYSV